MDYQSHLCKRDRPKDGEDDEMSRRTNHRRVEWMLHTYFDEMLCRRLMCNKPSPWGRVMADGGVSAGEFKSKLPAPHIDFTDPNVKEACRQMNYALQNLERVDEKAAIVIRMRYQRKLDGSQLSVTKCAELARMTMPAYSKRLSRAREWLGGFLEENYK